MVVKTPDFAASWSEVLVVLGSGLTPDVTWERSYGNWSLRLCSLAKRPCTPSHCSNFATWSHPLAGLVVDSHAQAKICSSASTGREIGPSPLLSSYCERTGLGRAISASYMHKGKMKCSRGHEEGGRGPKFWPWGARAILCLQETCSPGRQHPIWNAVGRCFRYTHWI